MGTGTSGRSPGGMPALFAGHLLLIRHGPSGARSDLPASAWELTEAGTEVCRQFAGRLLALRPGRFLASQEPKALATAATLAEALNVPYGPFPGLEEHARETVGWLASPADFEEAVARLLREPDWRGFGEESGAEALDRFRRAILAALGAFPGERLALVTHGTVMTLFLAAANPLDAVAYWRALTMPACAVLALPGFRLVDTLLA